MTVGRDPNSVDVGAGTVYWAPIGTAEPPSLTGAWASGWIDLGYTEKGSTFTRGVTMAEVDVAEEYYPVSTIITAYKSTVDFALSQYTAFNLQVAFNGGTITTNASGGWVQFDPPAAGTEVKAMLGWQSAKADERYIWRQCLQIGASNSSRQKVLPQALIPVSFNLEKPTGKQPFVWFGNTAHSGQ